MKKRSLILRILAVANALMVTAAFVGCPARNDPTIPTIAPPQIPPAHPCNHRPAAAAGNDRPLWGQFSTPSASGPTSYARRPGCQ